jgi:hypothetical protein
MVGADAYAGLMLPRKLVVFRNEFPNAPSVWEKGARRSKFEHKNVGAWLSLVERPVRDRKVAGSNPVAPILLTLFTLSSKSGENNLASAISA